MRSLKIWFTVACAVAMLPFAMMGKTDTTADARKEITADYAKSDAAAAKKDVDGMYTFYSSDFVGIDEDGKQETLKEVIAKGKQVIGALESLKVKTVIQQFSVKGKEATVTTAEHIEISATIPGSKDLNQGTIEEVSKDTWHKTAKGWRLTRSKTLSSKGP